jgi:hypothetical protein
MCVHNYPVIGGIARRKETFRIACSLHAYWVGWIDQYVLLGHYIELFGIRFTYSSLVSCVWEMLLQSSKCCKMLPLIGLWSTQDHY